MFGLQTLIVLQYLLIPVTCCEGIWMLVHTLTVNSENHVPQKTLWSMSTSGLSCAALCLQKGGCSFYEYRCHTCHGYTDNATRPFPFERHSIIEGHFRRYKHHALQDGDKRLTSDKNKAVHGGNKHLTSGRFKSEQVGDKRLAFGGNNVMQVGVKRLTSGGTRALHGGDKHRTPGRSKAVQGGNKHRTPDGTKSGQGGDKHLASSGVNSVQVGNKGLTSGGTISVQGGNKHRTPGGTKSVQGGNKHRTPGVTKAVQDGDKHLTSGESKEVQDGDKHRKTGGTKSKHGSDKRLTSGGTKAVQGGDIHQTTGGTKVLKGDNTCPISGGAKPDYKSLKSGKTIMFIKKYGCKKPWQEAQQQCLAEGAMLVKLESKRKNRKVRRAFKHRLGQASERFWIGLSDRYDNNTWYWTDGTALGPYINWESGQPNHVVGRQQENCVVLTLRSFGSGEWADYSCDARFKFICEKRL